ncbi:sel1 repeat family protein (plasmid) [Photobacterium sp. GJ3]|uniref:tetratricopeptide repeat protein n=1 Tax=Photobacterium sp. GJ3 TaxID=2829502 RepID=UPI001B8AE58B|nr:tetratricopeptide repeat protein [Photobacterium sp. GJ3]QUJ69709.1 sel1 repeat family protein [Photobacterium sp. GJ3]
MSQLGLGICLGIVLLIVAVSRYFALMKELREAAREQARRDEKYRQVLEQAKAVEHEEKVRKAQSGHIPSILSLAKENEIGNLREALSWYQKAAQLGNEIGQNALARLSRQDVDDPHGEAKSRYWECKVKANHNDLEALFEIGRYEIRGFGTAINAASGVGHLIKAAEMEYVPAQIFLGDWYVVESNPSPSPRRAFFWRLKSAVNQDPLGCIKVAYCYQTGIGVAKDRRRAIYWLEKATELGNVEAQYLAGKMHLNQDQPIANVTDAAVAYIWFSVAFASGYLDAKKERDMAVQHVGIESILNVQKVAKQIYKLVHNPPVPTHAIMDLLDKVYDRQKYRPSDAEMDSALGRVHEDIDDSEYQVVPSDGDSQDTPAPHSGQDWSTGMVTAEPISS